MTNLLKRVFGGGERKAEEPLNTPITAPAGAGTVPFPFYVRPSKKKEGVLIVGIETGEGRKRVALVRANYDGSVRVRTLNGNPREASSKAETQLAAVMTETELTDDE